MSLTIQPTMKTPIQKFKSISQVSNSFWLCKSRKYDFSNLNTKTQNSFRETFSQRLAELNNSLQSAASKETVLNNFVSLFETDVIEAHLAYQKKYERSLNSFEKSFHFLLKKSYLELRGGKRCPVPKTRTRKVYKYGFSRKERFLSPAHFACLLEDLIADRIDQALLILIREQVAGKASILNQVDMSSFSFWTTFYKNIPANDCLPVKKLTTRKTALKFRIRKFDRRLKNKKWALKLKRRSSTNKGKSQVSKPITKKINKVSPKPTAHTVSKKPKAESTKEEAVKQVVALESK